MPAKQLMEPADGETHQQFMDRCMVVSLADGDTRDEARQECQDIWDGDTGSDTGGKSATVKRAYSVLQIKSFDEDQRLIRGIATTPQTDHQDDIVEPKGAAFKLPIPFLFAHDSKQPIGHVQKADVTDNGIEVEVKLQKVTEPGKLKDRLDEAWQSIKYGLVRGLSIGFKDLESEPIGKGWGRRIKKWSWLELSAVVIAANSDASITAIKEIDSHYRAAASGNDAQPIESTASGQKAKPASVLASRSLKSEVRPMPMTNTDRMKGLEEKRAAEMGALEAIQNKVTDENRTKDESEQEAFDGHASTIKSIDRELSDCRMIERELIAKAKPPVVNNETGAVEFNRPVIQVAAPKLPPGIGLMKMLSCQLHAQQYHRDVLQVARQYCGQWPQVENALREKAAVATGTTTGATWASPLVYAQNLASEFVEYLLPMTFFGKIQGLTRVPFNVRIPRDTAAISAGWVGEGLSKGVAAGAFDSVTLTFNKIALIVGVTQELARFSNPSVETWARNKLADAIAKFTDEQFITPTITANAERPASITNGADTDNSFGTAATDLIHDIREILKHFQDNNIPTDNLVLLMQPQLATAIGSIYTTLGIRQFPDVTGSGGTVSGLQIITSGNCPVGQVTAIHAPSVAVADEGGLEIVASTEASVEMDDNPTGGDYHLVSAFQQNLLFIRAERFITWRRLRDKGVFYLTNAAYGGAVT